MNKTNNKVTNNQIISNNQKDASMEVTSTTTGGTTPTVPVVPEEPRTYIRTLEMEFYLIKEAINISMKDTPLREKVALYNFGDARFTEGLTLVGKVEEQIKLLDFNKRDKLIATQNAEAKRELAHEVFLRLRKVGRVAFEKNDRALKILGLNDTVKKAYGNWVTQVKNFYDHLLGTPEYVSEYAKYNVTQQEIEAGKQLLLDAENVTTSSIEIGAIAQTITDARNAAFKNLLVWWREYKKVVRIVLGKYPELWKLSEIVVLTRTMASRSSKSNVTPAKVKVKVPEGKMAA